MHVTTFLNAVVAIAACTVTLQAVALPAPGTLERRSRVLRRAEGLDLPTADLERRSPLPMAAPATIDDDDARLVRRVPAPQKNAGKDKTNKKSKNPRPIPPGRPLPGNGAFERRSDALDLPTADLDRRSPLALAAPGTVDDEVLRLVRREPAPQKGKGKAKGRAKKAKAKKAKGKKARGKKAKKAKSGAGKGKGVNAAKIFEVIGKVVEAAQGIAAKVAEVKAAAGAAANKEVPPPPPPPEAENGGAAAETTSVESVAEVTTTAEESVEASATATVEATQTVEAGAPAPSETAPVAEATPEETVAAQTESPAAEETAAAEVVEEEAPAPEAAPPADNTGNGDAANE
ncbi:hypothetical protein HDU96_008403 [Phlyctochytrium bullatum]|nr:hypothetical protein HDU96_008403 [Phlyctochytrium bullatum]